MTESSHFDYIIIGNGLAGLQLALELSSDAFFNDKQIALIDPSEKLENDKTWSFWETSSSKWDALVQSKEDSDNGYQWIVRIFYHQESSKLQSILF